MRNHYLFMTRPRVATREPTIPANDVKMSVRSSPTNAQIETFDAVCVACSVCSRTSWTVFEVSGCLIKRLFRVFDLLRCFFSCRIETIDDVLCRFFRFSTC